MAWDLKKLHNYVASLEDARLDYPFGEQPAVYKLNGKMFIIINEKARPLNISLKCDPGLAEILRQKYESVMPGYHLNKKHWNTIVLSGQLDDDEVKDLINHSYGLVKVG